MASKNWLRKALHVWQAQCYEWVGCWIEKLSESWEKIFPKWKKVTRLDLGFTDNFTIDSRWQARICCGRIFMHGKRSALREHVVELESYLCHERKWFRDSYFYDYFHSTLRLRCSQTQQFNWQFFLAEKGLRQGDPLSPLVFNLLVDVLTRMLIKASNANLIKGLCSNICPQSVICLQYADDVIC
jgi:hypothetical protein